MKNFIYKYYAYMTLTSTLTLENKKTASVQGGSVPAYMALHGHRPEASVLKPMNAALDETSPSDDNQQNEENQNNTSRSPHVITATTSIYFTHFKFLLSVDSKSPEFEILSCESDDKCFGDNNKQDEKYQNRSCGCKSSITSAYSRHADSSLRGLQKHIMHMPLSMIGTNAAPIAQL